jgi:ATP-dependent DNA helicase RecQ
MPPVHPAAERQLLLDLGFGAEIGESILPGDLSPSFQNPPTLSPTLARTTLGIGPLPIDQSLPFGSSEEVAFLNWVEKELGLGSSQWFTPQARLDKMVYAACKDVQGVIEVDFLVQPPWMQRFLVEIDGAQHEAAEAVDKVADDAAGVIGLDVLRIPTTEIHAGNGPMLDQLRERWEQTPDDAALPALVLAPVQLHRVVLAILEGLEAGFLTGSTWSIRLHDSFGGIGGRLAPYLETIAAVDDLWGGETVSPQRVDVATDGGCWTYIREDGFYHLAEFSASPIDIELFIESDKLPTAPLPLGRASVPRVVVRSAIVPASIFDGRGDGVNRRVRPDSHGPHVDRSLRVLLESIFAKADFREGQLEAIKEILAGRDCTVLLPTGAGKSLIYQLAGLCLPGRTIVIAPLVSLIEDQRDGMAANGIDRVVCLTSHELQKGGFQELHDSVAQGDALFILMAPERLQRKQFRDALTQLTARVPISFATIDEAHCVSDWGHDFRTSYLLVGRSLRACCDQGDARNPLPLLALTGTASRAVLKDVLAQLEFGVHSPSAIIKPHTFDRSELRFSLRTTTPANAAAILQGELLGLADRSGMTPGQFFSPRANRTSSGLIFCVTVDGGFGVMKATEAAASPIGSRPLMYSGRAPRGIDPVSWERVKRENSQRFKSDKSPVLVATSAFGMGIDKPNIRWVIHYGMPASIEEYYQQVGRAGRDRKNSECVLILIEYDEKRDRQLLGEENSLEAMRDQQKGIPTSQRDDVTTALFFHLSSFQGVDSELAALLTMVDTLEPGPERRDIEIPRENNSGQEQALARLVRLGVVDDYSIPKERAFGVAVAGVTTRTVVSQLETYIERSQPGRSRTVLEHLGNQEELPLRTVIENCARELITFVYETIERSRRRSVREMWQAARESSTGSLDANPDEVFRRRMLDYLSEGEVSPVVERLSIAPEFSFTMWREQLDELRDATTAQEWRGATARLLTSDPTNTGLLIARALSEGLSLDRDLEDVRSNIEGAFETGFNRFGITEATFNDIARWMLGWAAERDYDLLATIEIALQHAGYGVHVPTHPGVQAARSRDQLNGAIMVNHWHESLVQLDSDLSQLLNMQREGEIHA